MDLKAIWDKALEDVNCAERRNIGYEPFEAFKLAVAEVQARQKPRDPAILFAKPKAVSKADRAALKEAGVLVIELDDPQAAKLTRAHAEVDGTDLLRIACQSIHEANSLNSVKDLFGRNLAAFLAGK